MPPRKKARKNGVGAGAGAGAGSHISNLPDGVLEHMLSFLPARDAVRTCVLAKRWRHLWKSATGLRFVSGERNEPNSLFEIEEFVDHLLSLRLRAGTPLDRCEFRFVGGEELEFSHITLWMRVALQCKIQVLRLKCVGFLDSHRELPVFVSQYLKKLVLEESDLQRRSLDFSFCPFLEDLEIDQCYLDGASLISSQSLKRLTIKYCYFDNDRHMPICAPNLVSLLLLVGEGRTPSLERMPSLLTAVVGYDDVSLHSDDGSKQSILLQGLSEVRNLVLMYPDTTMFLFRKELKFCSSFNKLKYLTLGEYWWEPTNFSALVCLLKLCPVLEKLTLQLGLWGKSNVMKLSCKLMEMSAAISRHLKTIEVKCDEYDERINNVLMFLSEKLNIWFQFGRIEASA